MSNFASADFAHGLLACAVAELVVFGVTFVVARRNGRWATVDVSWGLSFVAVAATSFAFSAGSGADLARRLAVLCAVGLWGLRLAGYIFWRSRGKGEDPRYEAMMAKAKGSVNAHAIKAIFAPQALISFVVSLPVQVACYQRRPFGPLEVLGLAVWALGIFFEAVGDAQMHRFRSNPANRGQVMDSGLWRYTRHPNYFGDTCVWGGLWLLGAGQWQGALTLPSVVLMWFFLYFASGKALLESMMIKTKPGYADYAARTSGFFPWPPKRSTG